LVQALEQIPSPHRLSLLIKSGRFSQLKLTILTLFKPGVAADALAFRVVPEPVLKQRAARFILGQAWLRRTELDFVSVISHTLKAKCPDGP